LIAFVLIQFEDLGAIVFALCVAKLLQCRVVQRLGEAVIIRLGQIFLGEQVANDVNLPLDDHWLKVAVGPAVNAILGTKMGWLKISYLQVNS